MTLPRAGALALLLALALLGAPVLGGPGLAPAGAQEGAGAATFIGSERDADTLLQILGARAPRDVEQVGHSSVTLKLDLTGVHAAFKPRSRTHRRGHLNEAAAYRIARTLGMDNVPPVRVVRMPRRVIEPLITERDGEPAWEALRRRMIWDQAATCRGASIYWIPDLTPTDLDEEAGRETWTAWLRVGGAVPEGREDVARDLSRMVAFDYLIANWDRFSGGNVSTTADGQRVYVRDHNVAFTAPLAPNLYERVREHLGRTERFDRAFVRGLTGMTRASLREALAPDRQAAGQELLTEEQMDELFARREALASYISALIAVHGVERVLW